jgi:subtilisin family serine protease
MNQELTVRLGETHNVKKHPKQPDNDPMDYQGHGTHVAGIIAAENEWYVEIGGMIP